MIRLKRLQPPSEIVTQEFLAENEKMLAFHQTMDLQTRYDFQPYSSQIKNALGEMNKKKCSYCESLIPENEYWVDMFRPRSIYWWLSYAWENMFLSCVTCAVQYRANDFPIRKREDMAELINKSVKDLNDIEQPLLIDPCLNDPIQHFTYEIVPGKEEIKIVSETPKGIVSIEAFGLNRQSLLSARYQQYMAVKSNLEKAQPFLEKANFVNYDQLSPEEVILFFEHLGPIIDSSQPFAGMIQFLAKRLLEEADEFIKVQTEKESPLLVIKKFVPVRIELNNFRSLEHIELTLRSAPENIASDNSLPDNDAEGYKESWLLLLGENGVGKSSILQAIALALLPDEKRAEYLPNAKEILRKKAEQGEVKIHLDSGETIQFTFNDKGETTSNIREFHDYLIAYGSTRLLPRGPLQPETVDSRIKVGNLFDYSIALEDAIQWLLGRNEEDFDQAARFLKDLLFLKNKLERKDGDIITEEETGIEVRLSALSDGYQTLLALAVDMLKVFATQVEDERYRDIRDYAKGVVLIDEIDTHLHPSWKMRIVSRLRAALPNVFFIVTSHEPLCLRGLRDKEVAVLVKDETTQKICALENLPSPAGLRIDQILTSPLFGLQSTIDPKFENLYNRYYELLRVPAENRTADQQKEIASCQQKLKESQQLGETPREELFYYAIDELMAKKVTNDTMVVEDLKPEVLASIQSLLDKFNASSLL